MDTLIYLASKSPRRREILSNLGWEPVVLADPKAPRGWFAGDEEEKPGETPEDYVLRTAVVKLMDGLCARNELPDAREDRPVLAADTVVSLDGRVLGKPRDRAEAEAFLRSMSGRTHEVRTAVAVGINRAEWDSVVVTSTVEMRELTDAEIAAYAATAFKVQQDFSFAAFQAVIPQSWVCPCANQVNCWLDSGPRRRFWDSENRFGLQSDIQTKQRPPKFRRP